MGTGEDELPIGLQIIGPRLGDHAVLRVAAAWERLEPWGRPRLEASSVTVAAGSQIDGVGGERVVLRAYSPADGETVLETEPAG
jgi:hypothetical protein